MGMTKLGGPISSTQADTLSVDEGEKGENGRQLARGNDRVATIQAGTERTRARRAGGREGTGPEVATACTPDVCRTEGMREGTTGVSQCRARWSANHTNKKI